MHSNSADVNNKENYPLMPMDNYALLLPVPTIQNNSTSIINHHVQQIVLPPLNTIIFNSYPVLNFQENGNLSYAFFAPVQSLNVGVGVPVATTLNSKISFEEAKNNSNLRSENLNKSNAAVHDPSTSCSKVVFEQLKENLNYNNDNRKDKSSSAEDGPSTSKSKVVFEQLKENLNYRTINRKDNSNAAFDGPSTSYSKATFDESKDNSDLRNNVNGAKSSANIGCPSTSKVSNDESRNKSNLKKRKYEYNSNGVPNTVKSSDADQNINVKSMRINYKKMARMVDIDATGFETIGDISNTNLCEKQRCRNGHLLIDLTVDLAKTYQKINDDYYKKKKEKQERLQRKLNNEENNRQEKLEGKLNGEGNNRQEKLEGKLNGEDNNRQEKLEGKLNGEGNNRQEKLEGKLNGEGKNKQEKLEGKLNGEGNNRQEKLEGKLNGEGKNKQEKLEGKLNGEGNNRQEKCHGKFDDEGRQNELKKKIFDESNANQRTVEVEINNEANTIQNNVTSTSHNENTSEANLPQEEIIIVRLSEQARLIRRGEIWNDNYTIEGVLGEGTFGQVLKARDRLLRKVAIKIIKKDGYNAKIAANVEIKILEKILRNRQVDEVGASRMIQLLNHFQHLDHFCLVFERLGSNLLNYISRRGLVGLSFGVIRHLTSQICEGLRFLKQPAVSIIHCDIKPENILLFGSFENPMLQLADFGSSFLSNQEIKIKSYIQSRLYRAPEIILNLDFSHPIDIWSVGCIVVEMHTSSPLFVSYCQHDLLLKIIEVLGMPPKCMINSSRLRHLYFQEIQPDFYDHYSEPRYLPNVVCAEDGNLMLFHGISSTGLGEIVGLDTGGPGGLRARQEGHLPSDYKKFVDLIEKMLMFEPSKRITPEEVLEHQFIKVQSPNLSNIL